MIKKGGLFLLLFRLTSLLCTLSSSSFPSSVPHPPKPFPCLSCEKKVKRNRRRQRRRRVQAAGEVTVVFKLKPSHTDESQPGTRVTKRERRWVTKVVTVTTLTSGQACVTPVTGARPYPAMQAKWEVDSEVASTRPKTLALTWPRSTQIAQISPNYGSFSLDRGGWSLILTY